MAQRDRVKWTKEYVSDEMAELAAKKAVSLVQENFGDCACVSSKAFYTRCYTDTDKSVQWAARGLHALADGHEAAEKWSVEVEPRDTESKRTQFWIRMGE